MKSAIITAAILALASTAQARTSLEWTDASTHIRRTGPAVATLSPDTTLVAWRGQRLGIQALLRPDAKIAGTKLRPRLKGIDGDARFMRYTLTNDFRACGVPPELPAWEVADIIDLDEAHTVNDTTNYPLWVTIEIPYDAPAGSQPFTLELVDDATGAVAAAIPGAVRVQDATLPSPQSPDYFHLNLWQQPYAISRYYNVEPWSAEHLRLLEPYARFLARAGQKTISTIMFYEPWGEQSNDKFQPMVETTRRKDGTWEYDYTIFDRYVEFMDSMGVGPIIECFTMIPWEMSFRYRDEAKGGEYTTLTTTTDAPEYAELWSNFLAALKAHLYEKGWTDRAVISMDERGMTDILRAYDIVQTAAPGLKVSLAGNYHEPLVDKMYTYSITQGDPWPAEALERRRNLGLVSTLYTCCSSPAPNIFSNSAPADAAWLPAYCVATGTDGYLHWSYQNWTDTPLEDTRFKLFAPGDTYFIYPDGRSSIRYERMVEGIQMAEKIKALRKAIIAKGDVALLERLNQALLPLQTGLTSRNVPTAKVVADLQAALAAITDAL